MMLVLICGTDLRLEIGGEENVRRLDVPVDDPPLAAPVQVVETPGDAHGDVVPEIPGHRRRVLVCRRSVPQAD